MYDDYPDYESDIAFDYNESEDREYSSQDWEIIESREWDYTENFPVVEPLDNGLISW